MSTVALGIAPNTSNIGVTPLVHRRILGAQFANCGIIDGLNVTGRNDLRYNVGAGVAVCSRGDSDGKTIAYHEGGQTPAVSAGDPSNPRIDIVWICRSIERIGDHAKNIAEHIIHIAEGRDVRHSKEA